MKEPLVLMSGHGCSSCSVLVDPVLVASTAATGLAISMTAKEARWLLCEFPSASARLYAEFRRLRETFSPAEGALLCGM